MTVGTELTIAATGIITVMYTIVDIERPAATSATPRRRNKWAGSQYAPTPGAIPSKGPMTKAKMRSGRLCTTVPHCRPPQLAASSFLGWIVLQNTR
jgi:hypothetical protein